MPEPLTIVSPGEVVTPPKELETPEPTQGTVDGVLGAMKR